MHMQIWVKGYRFEDWDIRRKKNHCKKCETTAIGGQYFVSQMQDMIFWDEGSIQYIYLLNQPQIRYIVVKNGVLNNKLLYNID